MAGTHNEMKYSLYRTVNRRETRRKKGKGKKKNYTTGQSEGRKIVRRTEKDGRRQIRVEAVKPVG